MYPVKDSAGQVKCFLPFPQATAYHKTSTLLVQLERELGLSPSARSRIMAPHPLQTSPPVARDAGSRSRAVGF